MRDFTTEQSKKYFGANLRKAKANYDEELKRAKTEFVKKYPYADVKNFKFQIFLSRYKKFLARQKFTSLTSTERTGKSVPWPLTIFIQARFTGARQKFGTRVRR